jgi:hypothetical protein
MEQEINASSPGSPVLLSPFFAGSTAVLGADRPLRRREHGPLDHINARPDLYEILEERYGRAQPFSPDKACNERAKRSDLEVEPVAHSIRLPGLGAPFSR